MHLSPKILLIEDEDSIVTALKKQLLESGYEVRIARNGLEGLQRLEQELPDLVLLDVIMPEMDGVDFLTKAQEIPGFKTIKVVVLTNLSSGEQVAKLKSFELDDFIIKSDCSMREILERIKTVLDS